MFCRSCSGTGRVLDGQSDPVLVRTRTSRSSMSWDYIDICSMDIKWDRGIRRCPSLPGWTTGHRVIRSSMVCEASVRILMNTAAKFGKRLIYHFTSWKFPSLVGHCYMHSVRDVRSSIDHHTGSSRAHNITLVFTSMTHVYNDLFSDWLRTLI